MKTFLRNILQRVKEWRTWEKTRLELLRDAEASE